MLIPKIRSEVENKSFYYDFISTYYSDIKSLWNTQFNNEDISEYGCQWTHLAQYKIAYNYIYSLQQYISFRNHDLTAISTTYNLEDNTKNFACNDIDILDLYDIFDIEFDSFNLSTWIDNGVINARLLVTTNGNVTISTALTGTSFIEWGDGVKVAFTNGANVKSLNVGVYDIKIYGDLDLITSLTITGTANYSLIEFMPTLSLNNLTTLSLGSNDISSKSVDMLLSIMNTIATLNNLQTGTITINGGTTSNTMLYLEDAARLAQCNLINFLGWTINKNDTLTLNCS